MSLARRNRATALGRRRGQPSRPTTYRRMVFRLLAEPASPEIQQNPSSSPPQHDTTPRSADLSVGHVLRSEHGMPPTPMTVASHATPMPAPTHEAHRRRRTERDRQPAPRQPLVDQSPIKTPVAVRSLTFETPTESQTPIASQTPSSLAAGSSPGSPVFATPTANTLAQRAVLDVESSDTKRKPKQNQDQPLKAATVRQRAKDVREKTRRAIRAIKGIENKRRSFAHSEVDFVWLTAQQLVKQLRSESGDHDVWEELLVCLRDRLEDLNDRQRVLATQRQTQQLVRTQEQILRKGLLELRQCRAQAQATLAQERSNYAAQMRESSSTLFFCVNSIHRLACFLVQVIV
eukprot:c18726_g1_i4.p1 GENE.c18726_g1_i4~~c18726_g1_i4.p1  ORF type:complete len:347 (+),score=43.52 c18726_g1_i4:46-1086(+)